MRSPFIPAVLAFALFTFCFVTGSLLGEPVDGAPGSERAHNSQVIATTEMASQRYSVMLGHDQNLLPDWAASTRYPMSELDDYYRN